jgi:hypothetical protein
VAQLVTKAPPGMHFEPAASFSETAIEPTVLPRKEARQIESASPIRGYSHGASGAIRDCPYGRRIKERLATTAITAPYPVFPPAPLKSSGLLAT